MSDRFSVTALRHTLSLMGRYLLLATLVGLLLGALGPFGTYLNGGILLRASYWIFTLWCGLFLYGSSITLWRRMTSAGSLSSWFLLIVVLLLVSVPQTIFTRMLAFRFWPRLADLDITWTLWYVQVAALSSFIAAGFMVVRHYFLVEQDVEGRIALPPLYMLKHLTPDIVALQMEDHYVRIHSSSGSRLVLMSLGQAIEGLDGKQGIRTHRSWWVARSAVKKINGTPRSMTLTLSNGTIAPVARSAVATLRSEGWLEG